MTLPFGFSRNASDNAEYSHFKLSAPEAYSKRAISLHLGGMFRCQDTRRTISRLCH